MMLKTSRLICLMCSGLMLAMGIPTRIGSSSSMPPAAQEALNPAAQEAVNKGMSAHEQENYLAAITHFQEARRAAPNAPEIFLYLGVSESKIPGRELRAISWLGAYLAARPYGPNAATVTNQISKLKLAHQNTLALVIRSVTEAARFSERKGPSMREVVKRWANLGDLTSAMQIAADMRELPESQAEAYAAIAEVQAKARDIAGAMKTTSLIADSQPAKGDAWHYVVIFQVGSDLAGAQKTIEQIQDPKTKDRSKRIVSDFQAKTGDLAGALKTTASIQDEEVRGWARHDIAFVQVEAGDMTGALNTATLIPVWVDQGAVLDHVCLSYAKQGELDQALKVIALIGHAEKNYDVSVVQSFVAQAQMKSGDAGAARKMLESARQSAGLIPSGDRRWMALRRIANVQAKMGDVAGALAVTDQMESAYWKGLTQGEIAEAQAKGGDVAGALKTADLIQYEDNDMKSQALHGVAEVRAKGGDFAGALVTANSIPSMYRKAHSQRIIAELQVQSGDLAAAQKTVGLIQDSSAKKEAQETIDKARFKSGDSVTLWLQVLEDSDPNHECPLATAPFLDLPRHLQSVSASEEQKLLFVALYRTFIDMIDAEIVVNKLLDQQAGK